MANHKNKTQIQISRRNFLQGMSWAPMLFLPAPLFGAELRSELQPRAGHTFPYADLRFTPHYPSKTPLDNVFRQVIPGGDEFVTEKYVFELMPLLLRWSEALKVASPALSQVSTFLDTAVSGTSFASEKEMVSRSGAIEILRKIFSQETISGREKFLDGLKKYFEPFAKVETAEFQIVGVQQISGTQLKLRATIRYDIVGTKSDGWREQRIGQWDTQWVGNESGEWKINEWLAGEEAISRCRGPIFADVTESALGGNTSYENQMLRGADYWRTVLDGASGIDVYGNNGVAVGDINNDGFDEIYVCQPAGLPNRLYRNRGSGTFEDITASAGLGVLDASACALFADFENKGLQDLLVVCGSGPLLFLNQGNEKFLLKPDAFKFARPPQGTFTHAAIADYDRDGRLDIYFCLYSYYLGLDQYHYPAPYYDARNGPPNFLMHNEGSATFQDRTAESGLNADNDRYSFSCAWGDYAANGLPNLYVANDFGRSNLYRNNGDGTFASIATEAAVEDAGAGMSTTWFDFDGDGHQDIYVANMWAAAGSRISEQKVFHEHEPAIIREQYRRHASGNSLYRNLGNGKFENVSHKTNVDMGRWAWSSDSWDFDHDGYPDLYVSNGYISGADKSDLSSFFWRQVVGKSPQDATPSTPYEQGWNVINELIRSDSSWSGYERNVLYLNHHDGTFSDVSGILGMDFPDDSRAFALADLDHDGRLEVVLKNRNAPQLRILHNAMPGIGNSISFRLRGTKSNRDAIGTAVTIEADGHSQTKYIQAGSGFLSQHSKELFFGLGKADTAVRATLRWPSGVSQTFENLPANHRIETNEGSQRFSAEPFSGSSFGKAAPSSQAIPQLPSTVETWLIEPLPAPGFVLADTSGKNWDLSSLRGRFLLLTFWSIESPASVEQLRGLGRNLSANPVNAGAFRVLAMNLDDPSKHEQATAFATRDKLPFPILLATPAIGGVYNIVYRYLFDRRRDLAIPTSFLIDENGMIVKVYQGVVDFKRLHGDWKTVPVDVKSRIAKALPFDGQLHQGQFSRNDFTYGVAFFQRGYLDQAAESFKQVIASRPDDPEAYYNLGTLYLRRNDFTQARQYLEQTVKLRSNYPEAWNNLGMLAAQQGQVDVAIENFKRSLQLRPEYAIAMVNLGNVYRRQKSFDEAGKLLQRALELQPQDPEVNYSLGMLYAQQEQIPKAEEYLQKSVNLRPDYPDALNNLGVMLVREQRYSEALEKFTACIQIAPNFDQAYMNLARLYVIQNDKEKARKTLRSLLRQQPGHKMAQQALEVLN